MNTEKQLSEIVDVLNKINRSLNATVGFDVYTDATRPGPATVPAGYTIFNSSDNFLNTSDGANWRNQAGAVT